MLINFVVVVISGFVFVRVLDVYVDGDAFFFLSFFFLFYILLLIVLLFCVLAHLLRYSAIPR